MGKIRYWLCICLIGAVRCFAQQAHVCSSDSAKVERLLMAASRLPADSNRVLFFAHSLIGTPYEAGTLEGKKKEQLVVTLGSFDCMTFVETVIALAWCDRLSQQTFADYCDKVRVIRYRNGIVDTYASRLHYFSDWVEDNSRKGILRERTDELEVNYRLLSLNFMTVHADLYPALQDASILDSVRAVEKRWESYRMPYVAKEALNASADTLNICDGDILALTTLKEGLDVVHVGFACWIHGKLHLLHASSLKGEVLLDSLPLYQYLKGRKTYSGVRVVSLKEEI